MISFFRFNKDSLIGHYANQSGFENVSWHQLQSYQKNNFVLGFAKNFPSDPMTTPANYNQDNVLKVIEKYQGLADQYNQKHQRYRTSFKDIDIVFILSESLSDPRRVNGVSLDSNPLPYIQSTDDKSYSGLMLSPTYGGGTPNTEFEVLTQLNNQFLNENLDNAYSSIIPHKSTFPSFVDDFKYKNESAKAVAMHAFNSSMFKRKDVFRVMGFDVQKYDRDFKYTDKIDDNSYISDDAAYQEILNYLDENRDYDNFIHMITMQNHSSYADKYRKYDFEVTGDLNEDDKSIIRYYSQGIYYSDQATKEFIDAISKRDKKTIVLLYGDHLPGIYGNVRQLNDNLSLGLTDFFIYSNFETEHKSDLVVSPNLFSSMIYDLADVKLTAFNMLTKEYRRQIPISKGDQFYDSEMNSYQYDELAPETKIIIDDYYLIQYDIISGQQYSLDYMKVR